MPGDEAGPVVPQSCACRTSPNCRNLLTASELAGSSRGARWGSLGHSSRPRMLLRHFSDAARLVISLPVCRVGVLGERGGQRRPACGGRRHARLPTGLPARPPIPSQVLLTPLPSPERLSIIWMLQLGRGPTCSLEPRTKQAARQPHWWPRRTPSWMPSCMARACQTSAACCRGLPADLRVSRQASWCGTGVRAGRPGRGARCAGCIQHHAAGDAGGRGGSAAAAR